MTQRFKVIGWQRGSYSVVDTSLPVGHPGRGVGAGSVGYRRKRDAEAAARRMNREYLKNGEKP